MGFAVLAASEGISPGLIWAGLGLLLLSFFLPRLFIKRRASGGASRALSREREVEVRKTLDEVFLQLQEFSRETLAKLDTRIRMLNQLIVDADERIRKSQALPRDPASSEGGAAGGPTRVEGVAAAPAPSAPPPPPPPPPTNPIHDRIWRLLEEGATINDVSREVGLPKGEVELIAGLRGLPERSP